MATIYEVREKLLKIFKQNIRKEVLDEQIHFVPLNLKAIEISLGHILATKAEDEESYQQIVSSLEEFRSNIINFVVQKHTYKIYLSNQGFKVQNYQEAKLSEISSYTPAVVYFNNEVVGVIYKRFGVISSALFSSYLNKELSKFIKSSLYEGTNFKKGFDIGHIFDPNSQVAKTPLGEKLKLLLSALNDLSDEKIEGVPLSGSTLESIRYKVENSLHALSKKSTYGPRIQASLDKHVTDFIKQINANIVIIQDRKENQFEYGSLIEGLTSKEVTDLLLTINFSKNIPEEILVRTKAFYETGKGLPSSRSKKKVDESRINQKLALTISKNKRNIVKVPLKRTQESLTNLDSLLTMINASLHDQIRKNMGKGERTDVLNYRTGRFARSAEVNRMTMSREGAITAFYTYMKNPYATFSEGGQQSRPRTRDPKLLISKSIRELAATRVANRLRAVVV